VADIAAVLRKRHILILYFSFARLGGIHLSSTLVKRIWKNTNNNTDSMFYSTATVYILWSRATITITTERADTVLLLIITIKVNAVRANAKIKTNVRT